MGCAWAVIRALKCWLLTQRRVSELCSGQAGEKGPNQWRCTGEGINQGRPQRTGDTSAQGEIWIFRLRRLWKEGVDAAKVVFGLEPEG